MPYYCTVPRCTSMAGKAKNVSFHQFPRDVELARLWNEILKRGKPYTKYSKVCSLHFRPEDYTITSVGKNKGQWRTLRKDAIPSQNLPSDSPTPPHRRRSSGAWLPDVANSAADPRMQQQIAQAIYLQTMLAMQVAVNGSQPAPVSNVAPNDTFKENSLSLTEVEEIIRRRTQKQSPEEHPFLNGTQETSQNGIRQERTSYKCELCAKCFKDPDVFILHKRTHNKNQTQDPNSITSSSNEKENLDANQDFSKQDTLKANPILANLLKSTPSMNQALPPNVFDVSTILSVENQIMQALAANMESYIRDMSSMQQNNAEMDDESHDRNASDDGEINDLNSDQSSSKHNSVTQNIEHIKDFSESNVDRNSIENSRLDAKEDCIEHENDLEKSKNCIDDIETHDINPNCDSEDLELSKDSNNLVIDETV